MNNKVSIIVVMFISLTIMDSNAIADQDKFLLTIGLADGGDKLVDIVFADGSTSSIKAGEGLYVDIGGIISLNASESLQTQLTAGIFTETSEASNGDIEFSRVPLNALLMYRYKNLRWWRSCISHKSKT